MTINPNHSWLGIPTQAQLSEFLSAVAAARWDWSSLNIESGTVPSRSKACFTIGMQKGTRSRNLVLASFGAAALNYVAACGGRVMLEDDGTSAFNGQGGSKANPGFANNHVANGRWRGGGVIWGE